MNLRCLAVFSGLALASSLSPQCLQAVPVLLHPALKMRSIVSAGPKANGIRLARDPRNNELFMLKFDGTIHRIQIAPPGSQDPSTSTLVYDSSHHGLTDASGLAAGSDGTLYVVGNNTTSDGAYNIGVIMRGTPNEQGVRVWSNVAQTAPYPLSQTGFDHTCNGIMVSQDESYLLLNSGSRTDHGEVQSAKGLFPGLRETDLSACILKIPITSTNLVLPNDRNALREGGYLFVEGVRNTYDMAYAPNGDIFGTENGPDRDMSEELNWLRPGRHYGFPWRVGGQDNPQQFSDYDPALDKLLNPRFSAVRSKLYVNDPSFPPTPVVFAEPVVNHGPDADSYRDPVTGDILDASERGETISTFTAHRSPLGILFDLQGALSPEFRHHGFIASWTAGDPNGASVAGPFRDASQDILDVVLEKNSDGSNYSIRCKRIAAGFGNPIDTEWIGHRMYVLEYAAERIIWEIEFPTRPSGTLSVRNAAERQFSLQGQSGVAYRIETSPNLSDWTELKVMPAEAGDLTFTDPAPVETARYYRAVPTP